MSALAEAEAGMAGAESGADQATIDAGFAQMSKIFRETGGELYIGAGGREHD